MTDFAPPLVPADCDLRDFPFMPVDITRLFGSGFHASSNDSEWRAGVTLWMKSYHQVPAASLPDDDAALTMLADLGRDQKTWKKLKPKALHGWIKCNDGRLYHKVVAEKALEAWIEKLAQRKVSSAGNAKRWGNEADTADIETAIEQAVDLLRTLNPNSRQLLKRTRKGQPTESKSNPAQLPLEVPQHGNGNANGTPVVIPSGSQETETGTENISPTPRDADPKGMGRATVWNHATMNALHARLVEEGNIGMAPVANDFNGLAPIIGLIDAGFDIDLDILPAIRKAMENPDERPKQWKYFIGWIETARRNRLNAKKRGAATIAAEPPQETFRQKRERIWTQQLTAARKLGAWSDHWGAPPGSPSCEIPPEFVAAWEAANPQTGAAA